MYKKYFYLFAAGIVLTFVYKFDVDSSDFRYYMEKYILLGKSVEYSLLYYITNLFLGNTYLFLFRQNYLKANSNDRIPSEVARAVSGE